jgi:hypothetical protein
MSSTSVISKTSVYANITIDNHVLEQVHSFIYLGGTIIDEGSTSEKDVKRRIGLAHGAMQALNPIWISKHISTTTKVSLYKVLVLSIALYSAETWTLKAKDLRRLNTFEMSCLRRILGVSRKHRLRNEHIRSALELDIPIQERIHTKRLPDEQHTLPQNCP